jgi:hypothetical protein
MARFRVAVLAALWMVAGCSAAGGRSLAPDESTGPSSRPGSIELPAAVIDPVVAEIARVSGVPADQVVVVSAASVTFPDGSLGCPLPGMAYTQVMTDGYRIVATAAGTTYDYRGTGSSFRRCVDGAALPSKG